MTKITAEERMRRLYIAFRNTFDTPDGREVLDNLRFTVDADKYTPPEDPYRMAYENGRKSVYWELRNILRQADKVLLEEADDRGDSGRSGRRAGGHSVEFGADGNPGGSPLDEWTP